MSSPNPPAPTTDANPAADADQNPQAGTNPTADAKNTPNFNGDFDPDKAKAALQHARNDFDTEKQKRQGLEKEIQELKDGFAKALGLKKDDDPEEIAKKLTEEQKRTREAMVELATYKACQDPKVGVNATALLDSRAFLSRVADLDPTASTFQAEIAKAVSAAVAANPLLKSSPGKGSSKSGADFSAGASSAAPEPKTPHQRLMRAFSTSGGS